MKIKLLTVAMLSTTLFLTACGGDDNGSAVLYLNLRFLKIISKTLLLACQQHIQKVILVCSVRKLCYDL
jgi:hypothetical protein